MVLGFSVSRFLGFSVSRFLGFSVSRFLSHSFLLLFISLFFLTSTVASLFAQSEESGPEFTNAELVLFVTGAGNNDVTKFTLSSLDAPTYCNVSSACSINVTSPQQFIDESIEIPGNNSCTDYGFKVQYCGDYTYGSEVCGVTVPLSVKPLKKGYFKLIISVRKSNESIFTEKAHLFYDNRDSRFPSQSVSVCNVCTPGNFHNDLIVKIDHSNYKLQYALGSQLIYRNVTNGALLSIEQVNEIEEACYENYESRYFAAITTISRSQSNNPVINWSAPYGSPYDFGHYRIERSINSGSFEFVDYVYNEQTTSYNDGMVWWDPITQGEIEITYRVLTFYDDEGMYHYSNQKSILVTDEYPAKKYQSSQGENSPAITVTPNPFNGTTTVSLLNIPVSADVKVIDLLGREYDLSAEFVDKNSRRFRFEGNDLSSGIYFVIVRDNKNIYTNKIVLLK